MCEEKSGSTQITTASTLQLCASKGQKGKRAGPVAKPFPELYGLLDLRFAGFGLTLWILTPIFFHFKNIKSIMSVKKGIDET